MLNDTIFLFSCFLSKVNAAFPPSVYAHLHMSVKKVRMCVLRNVCQVFFNYQRFFIYFVSFALENIIHKEGSTTFCVLTLTVLSA